MTKTMIVNVKAELEKVEEMSNDSVGHNHDYGKGHCEIRQTVNLRGTWEFDSHPNLDAYAEWALDKGSLDILFSKIGFDPSWDFEFDPREVEVEINGTSEEWLEQAYNFHDGLYKDCPKEALETMASWENSNLDDRMIGKIEENHL